MDASRLYAAVILVALLAIPFIVEPWITAQHYRAMLAGKQGTVEDADTGRALPGVVLIANWRSYSSNAAGGWNRCQIQKAITTDASGHYAFPDVSNEFQFERVWPRQILARLFFIQPPEVYYDWQLVSFKKDYIGPRDITALRTMNERGEIRPQFTWLAPSVAKFGPTQMLEPTILVSKVLTPNDLFSYYAEITSQIEECKYSTTADRAVDAVDAVEHTMEEDAKTRVCSLPNHLEINGTMLMKFMSLIRDKNFLSNLTLLTGANINNWSDQSNSDAGILCSALTSQASP